MRCFTPQKFSSPLICQDFHSPLNYKLVHFVRWLLYSFEKFEIFITLTIGNRLVLHFHYFLVYQYQRENNLENHAELYKVMQKICLTVSLPSLSLILSYLYLLYAASHRTKLLYSYSPPTFFKTITTPSLFCFSINIKKPHTSPPIVFICIRKPL